MNTKSFLFGVVLVSGFISSGYAGPISPVGPPAGPFEPAIYEFQTGPRCSTPGVNLTQYHTHYDDQPPNPTYKYHAGEDWNGMCGGSTDENYPLRAIGDGKVVYVDLVDDSAKGKQLHVRYSFPYAFGSNDLQTFDNLYLHINGIEPSTVWWSGPGTGSTVSKGATVAYLGGTGNWTPHLHWEVQWDDDPNLLTLNNYQNPLTKSHALKFRPSALIVDDRRDELVYSIASGGYATWFTMGANAPSSTAYLEYGGQKKTLAQAVAAGWIAPTQITFQEGGSWYYHPNVDDHFFLNGRQFAIWANVSGSTLHIFTPRNGFQQDRARLDMLHEVEDDSRVANVLTQTYMHNPNWAADWELHSMWFQLTDGRWMFVNHATNKTNRLVRYTDYFDPDLGQWRGWQGVNWNVLY